MTGGARTRVLTALLGAKGGLEYDELIGITEYDGSPDTFDALLRGLTRNNLIFRDGNRFYHGAHVSSLQKPKRKAKPEVGFDIKIQTLDKLASLMCPSIGRVLSEIKADLQRLNSEEQGVR